jgi:hypothetical protein
MTPDHRAASHDDGPARTINGWLLTVLRFAVTRENGDRMCVLEAARAIDRASGGQASFSFFVRTSAAICDAMVSPDDRARRAALNRYFGFVDDRRLRAALEIAAGVQEPPRARRHAGPKSVVSNRAGSKRAGSKPVDLWKGLV